jgi:hypothetical protein
MTNKAHGMLKWTRQGTEVAATILWSRSVYTLVREDATGRLVRLRTDRLAEGTETERGHASFVAN